MKSFFSLEYVQYSFLAAIVVGPRPSWNPGLFINSMSCILSSISRRYIRLLYLSRCSTHASWEISICTMLSRYRTNAPFEPMTLRDFLYSKTFSYRSQMFAKILSFFLLQLAAYHLLCDDTIVLIEIHACKLSNSDGIHERKAS